MAQRDEEPRTVRFTVYYTDPSEGLVINYGEEGDT